MLKLAGLALSVLLLSVTGILPYVDAQTQTKYLTYQNQQYGFSIKYPSNWEKTETLVQSSIFPNMLDLVTFTTPTELTNYGVSLIKSDTTYKGLSGQKFLDKIKKDFADSFCSKVPELTCSAELFQLTTLTHQNGYTGYMIIFGIKLSSNQGSSESTIILGFYPNGNDVWVIGIGSSSDEEFQQYTNELNAIGNSFTISTYVGEQAATSQSPTITKSSVGTLQINSGYFTATKYSPAELIVSGEINDYLQGVPLTIKITKPDKSSDEQNILVTKDGAFRAPIKIDGAWSAGSYQLSAKYGTQDLGTVSFSVNMGSAPPPTPTPQTTKYLSYENKQYGFSIKYPSDLKKEETLTESDVFPNSINIVSFTTPSELSTIGITLIKDDTIFKGLSGQNFLDKMKNEFKSGVCSALPDPTLTCSMEVGVEESGTNQNGHVAYSAGYLFTISDNQNSQNVVVFATMFPDGNDVWVVGLGAFPGEDYKGIGEETGKIADTFKIYDYQVEQKQFSLQSKAAQENDIVYLVVRNPEDSSDDIYSIKLTNTNGKITNFIKIKDWTYKRVGADSVMYQTTTSPLDSSDMFKIALKVDSKNTELQWEAFSKDQKSLGTGKVKTS